MKGVGTARTLEALIGTSLGAGVGAITGATTYAPSRPVEWVDDYGEVQSRRLTSRERELRTSRAGKGALAGVAMGAGGALGLSRVLRSLRSAAERSAVGTTKGIYAGPLKEYLAVLKKRNPVQGLLPYNNRARARDARRIAVAEDLLSERTKRIEDLVGVAKAERDRSLFGGFKKHPLPRAKGKKREFVFSPQTHEGQIMHDIFGGPKGLARARRGPDRGEFAGRGLRGTYEELIEQLTRGV